MTGPVAAAAVAAIAASVGQSSSGLEGGGPMSQREMSSPYSLVQRVGGITPYAPHSGPSGSDPLVAPNTGAVHLAVPVDSSGTPSPCSPPRAGATIGGSEANATATVAPHAGLGMDVTAASRIEAAPTFSAPTQQQHQPQQLPPLPAVPTAPIRSLAWHRRHGSGSSNGSASAAALAAAAGSTAAGHGGSSANVSAASSNCNSMAGATPATTFTVPTSDDGPKYDFEGLPTVSTRRYVFVMVGLPARGKTFLAQKMCRMLAWLGHTAQVYNVQRLWRDLKSDPKKPFEPADFDFTKPRNMQSYERALRACGLSIKQFFEEKKGLVAFVNDDFVSPIVRERVEELIGVHADQTIYIEVTRDPSLNVAFDRLKFSDINEYGDDAAGTRAAEHDFYERVKRLQEQYVHVRAPKSFIRIHNGTHHEIHNVKGYLPSRMTSFLLNLNPSKVQHPIYFSRHGESEYNIDERLGGNPHLTSRGRHDAEMLKDFIVELKAIEQREGHRQPLQLWTSQLIRTIQTGAPTEKALGIQALRWRALNEIHAGVCEEMTYKEVKQQYPLIHEFRSKNKYTFRYPEGESYQDLVARLEPIILELENADRVVVVIAHQAVLRALLSYFGHSSAESSVRVEVPHRTVWRCTYSADGIATTDELRLPIGPGPFPVPPPTASLAAVVAPGTPVGGSADAPAAAAAAPSAAAPVAAPGGDAVGAGSDGMLRRDTSFTPRFAGDAPAAGMAGATETPLGPDAVVRVDSADGTGSDPLAPPTDGNQMASPVLRPALSFDFSAQPAVFQPIVAVDVFASPLHK
jgi:broad specificity phosphatase PhoE